MSNQLATAARQYLIATAHLGACPGTRDVLERAIAAHEAAKPAEHLGKAEHMPGANAFTTAVFDAERVPAGTKLYAAPVAVASQWQPLTDDEIKKLYSLNHWHDMGHFTWGAASVVVRAIEQAHGIKEQL